MSIIFSLLNFYERYNENNTEKFLDDTFKKQPVHFFISIKENGEFSQLTDNQQGQDSQKKSSKKVVQNIVVANEGGRTSGIKPYLFYEKLDYLFGQRICQEIKEYNDPQKAEAKHQVFLQRLRQLPDGLQEDTGVAALLKFYEQPEEIEKVFTSDYWSELAKLGASAWVAFKLAADDSRSISERPKVQEYFETLQDSGTSNCGFCPVLGKSEQPLVRLHPPLNMGQQKPRLVSFNASSFESYGKKQGANSPMSQKAAVRYGKALNYLLASDHHRWRFGDTQTLFWYEGTILSEQTKEFEEQVSLFGSFSESEDPEQTAKAIRFFKSVDKGFLGTTDSQQKFSILSLKPNMSRAAILHWQQTSLEELAPHLLAYFEDLELESNFPSSFINLRNLLASCAPAGKTKEFAQLHIPSLLRSAFLGYPFPQVLQYAVLQRIKKSQGKISHTQAALLKAFIVRQNRLTVRKNQLQEVIQVSLNKENSDVAYCLGRCLALVNHLENSREDKVTARFFNSLMTVPRAVFPRLISLVQYYAKRLKSHGKKGAALFRMREIEEVVNLIGDGIPQQLNPEQQCLFALGYCQQRTALFKKIEEKDQGESTDGEQ